MKTYIKQCQEKSRSHSEKSLEDFIDIWHTGESYRNVSLAQAIGLSDTEYAQSMFDSKKLMDTIAAKI